MAKNEKPSKIAARLLLHSWMDIQDRGVWSGLTESERKCIGSKKQCDVLIAWAYTQLQEAANGEG